MDASLPGALVRMDWIFSPASSFDVTCSGVSFASSFFCAGVARRVDALEQRLAELARELAIRLAGIAPGARRDLRRQQRRDDAVLVGGPHAAVLAQERRARALLAAETERPVEQAVDEPLEARPALRTAGARASRRRGRSSGC